MLDCVASAYDMSGIPVCCRVSVVSRIVLNKTTGELPGHLHSKIFCLRHKIKTVFRSTHLVECKIDMLVGAAESELAE